MSRPAGGVRDQPPGQSGLGRVLLGPAPTYVSFRSTNADTWSPAPPGDHGPKAVLNPLGLRAASQRLRLR